MKDSSTIDRCALSVEAAIKSLSQAADVSEGVLDPEESRDLRRLLQSVLLFQMGAGLVRFVPTERGG